MRGARCQLERPARIDLRISRPKWIGKDDHAAHAAGTAHTDARLSERPRLRQPKSHAGRAGARGISRRRPSRARLDARRGGRAIPVAVPPKWNQKLFSAILDHFRVDAKTRAKNMS